MSCPRHARGAGGLAAAPRRGARRAFLCAGALLAGAAIGLGGCQAIPRLGKQPPAQTVAGDPVGDGATGDPVGQSVAGDIVAGAATSLCVGALDWLRAEPARDVRLDRGAGWASGRRGDGSVGTSGTASPALGTAGVELVLRDVRDLPLPRLSLGTVTPMAEDGTAFLDDPRSRIGEHSGDDLSGSDLSGIVESTVLAADLAYDIPEHGGPTGGGPTGGGPTDSGRDHGGLRRNPDAAEVAAVARTLPGYVVRTLWVDDFSGFKAFALESRDGTHRIYAMAGTQVFESRDYRDWASGLMMARPQFVSDAALLLAADAADYAADPEHGGEVFFTGQSQGAVIAQASGILAQELLNGRPAPHRLMHIVTWGVTGATEPVVETIETSRRGLGRDVSPMLERHWWLTDAEHRAAVRVWRTLESRWSALGPQDVAAHVRALAGQMHVIGYFFDIDPFARVGTFLGTPLVFPIELVLPRRCEPLVTELLLDTRFGDLGLELESHFLKGYRRAVDRGAVELARPARIARREWILDVLPAAEGVSRSWLDNIYLGRLGADPANWERCFASGHWRTDANPDCRRRYWPGCAPRWADDEPGAAGDAAEWCLVTGDAGREGAGDVAADDPTDTRDRLVTDDRAAHSGR